MVRSSAGPASDPRGEKPEMNARHSYDVDMRDLQASRCLAVRWFASEETLPLGSSGM